MLAVMIHLVLHGKSLPGSWHTPKAPLFCHDPVLVVPMGNLERASPPSTSIAFKTQPFVGTAPRICQEQRCRNADLWTERVQSVCECTHREKSVHQLSCSYQSAKHLLLRHCDFHRPVAGEASKNCAPKVQLDKHLVFCYQTPVSSSGY